MKVLVVNAGSSSLKYQLFDTATNDVVAKGICERIGIDGKITHKMPGRENYVAEVAMPNHSGRDAYPYRNSDQQEVRLHQVDG